MLQIDEKDLTVFCDMLKLLIFSCPSILIYVLGAQKNHLIETVLLSSRNISFG